MCLGWGGGGGGEEGGRSQNYSVDRKCLGTLVFNIIWWEGGLGVFFNILATKVPNMMDDMKINLFNTVR